MNIENYQKIRNGGRGFCRQARGLIEVSGGEAKQFLDGLITNDMKTLDDGQQMSAAFPNAKGRLLAVVGILRKGDRFLFETEEATRQKIYENLFRFTYAGDFFVDDLSPKYQSYIFFGGIDRDKLQTENSFSIGERLFVPSAESENFEQKLVENEFIKVDDELFETLRIESGIPLYGIDMDEETVVPESGLADLISYNKGCYIGQEVIARIHFRGKVAKQLMGLIFEETAPVISPDAEIRSADDKNAGFITSVIFSPKLEKTIALAYVRNAFLEEGTELNVGEFSAKVKSPPFI